MSRKRKAFKTYCAAMALWYEETTEAAWLNLCEAVDELRTLGVEVESFYNEEVQR